MKVKIIIAILSLWAILATITAVDNENRRSRLDDECAELQEECEEQERAYEELEAEYAKLEVESEKWEDKYLDVNTYYTFHLAYEWLFDMVANQGNENYDPEAALNKICEREGLGILSKQYVAQEAQKIMSKYGYEIK